MGDDIDGKVAELVKSGALDRAATHVLEQYGSELYGFLVHTVGNESDAAEVFSQTAEDLWAGLPKFGFRCSIRTWIYVLGRNATSRFRRSPWNKRDRRTTESQAQSAAALARSRTQPWRRTAVKDRFSELRESLDPDDRTLLTLRIDRDLPWEDVARVMLGEDAEPDPAALTRETDRLRKRFQFLKTELRRRAEAAGLIDEAR
jgi:RNA polymerase sigma-70 factor (ECF subfamily)